jgi:iron complex outermembrane recepter protein
MKMTKSKAVLARILAAQTALTCLTVVPVHAASELQALEEIIVTAQRREQSLQDVPVSISALDNEALTARSIANIADLEQYIPGLEVTPGLFFGGAALTIRGVTPGPGTAGTENNTAIYLDDVYLPRGNTVLQQFLDVDRVEVLRGPQGTLYGRNATGGAVKIVTRDPSPEFSAGADLLYESYDHWRVRGSAGGALGSDKVMARLSLAAEEGDNFIRNITENVREKRVDQIGGRLSVLFQPSESASISLKADYMEDDGYGVASIVLRSLSTVPVFSLVNFPPEFGVTPTLPANPRHVALSMPDAQRINEMDSGGVNLTGTFELGSYSLKSISSFRWFETQINIDADRENIGTIDDFGSEESNVYTQELQLLSPTDQRISWIAGLYFFNEDLDSFLAASQPAFFLGSNDPALTAEVSVRTVNYAAFGQVYFDVTDKLRLTVGGRYNEDRRDIELDAGTFAGFDPATQTVLLTHTLSEADRTWDKFTPSVIVNYKFTPEVMAYASYSQGFKSGGFNAVSNLSEFEPEKIKAYEVGLKSTMLDGRLQLNSAAFWYDYTDLQTRVIDPITSTVFNADTELRGLELEGRMLPLRHTAVDFSVAYLDAEYTDFVLQNSRAAPPQPLVQVRGNNLPQTPEWKFDLGLEQTVQVTDEARLVLRAEYSYQSESFLDSLNTPEQSQDAYGLVNARAALMYGDRIEIAAYGRNLTDELYSVGGFFSSSIGDLFIYGPPRVYGVNFTYRY